MKRLEWLDIALTMLADYWEMKPLNEPAEPDIFTKLNNALDAYQALTEREFIRRLKDEQQPADTARKNDRNRYNPTGPKA